MTTIHMNEFARIGYVKGAPKEVLDLCTPLRPWTAEAPLTEDDASENHRAERRVRAQGLEGARDGVPAIADEEVGVLARARPSVSWCSWA